MLKVATVCSGIGAPEMALTRLDIPYELVCFSEINEAAIKSYCALHNIDRRKNIGSLAEVNEKPIPLDIDLLVGGTPCQSFSTAGKGEGGDEGSGTRSSLMWSYLQFIAISKPKVVIWENVPGVLSYKHIHNFRRFYFMLLAYGYNVYADVKNAKYFNVAQNRERLYLIAIRKDEDKGFEFPIGYDSGVRIKHILQSGPAKHISADNLKNMVLFKPYIGYNTHRIIKCGDLKWNNFRQNNIVLSINGISECLMCSNDSYTGAKIYDDRDVDNPQVRRPTPFESFKLMGFKDDDYYKCRYKILNGKRIDNVKESDLYMQAGNSIVVTVLMAIFGVLYSIDDWAERVFQERSKTPEQLIYELPLFTYMGEQKKDESQE